MSIEHPSESRSEEGRTLGQLVEGQLVRMKRMWSVETWEPERIAEYRSALLDVGDAEAIEAGVTTAIRGWGGKFAPSVANLIEIVRAEQSSRRPAAAHETHPTTPAWWARLIQGTLYASMERRGERRTWPAASEPFVEIARRHGLRPDDFCFGPGQEHRFTARNVEGRPLDGMAPDNHSERVGAAIAEARAIGEALGEADGEILAEMVGSSGKRVE